MSNSSDESVLSDNNEEEEVEIKPSKKTKGGGKTAAGKRNTRSKKTDLLDKEHIIDSDNEECENNSSEQQKIVPSTSVKRVLMSPKGIDWDQLEMIKLPHPTQGQSLFFLDTNPKSKKEHDFIFEILTLSQNTRSWFIDESIVSNGNVYVITPFDPLFLIILILAKSKQASRPLSDHLDENLPPKIASLFCSRLSSSQLENIAIRKVVGDGELEVYSYSEDKIIAWLVEKVEKMTKFLFKEGINIREASISSNFTKSSIVNKDEDKVRKEEEYNDEYKRYAVDIVSEYVNEDLKKKLLTKFGFPIIAVKRKSENDNLTNGKKAKVSSDSSEQPLEDYSIKSSATSAIKSSGKNNRNDAKLQKAAAGTHSIMKFFSRTAK